MFLTSSGKTFKSTNHKMGINKITNGMPIFIQSTKFISLIPAELSIETQIPFGGVPIIVPTPPTDAPHAIPNIMDFPKFDSPTFPPPCTIIPVPKGRSIAVVAVLEIHIEMNADTDIIPSRTNFESFAIFPRVSKNKVKRLSSFHFCIADASRNPLRNKNMIGFA